MPQTVATVLGLIEEPGKPIGQTLTEYLKDKRLLLLLDNCEHLLDGCAQLADTLVRQCPTCDDSREQPGSARHWWRAGVPRAVAVAARSEAGAHAGLRRAIRGGATVHRPCPALPAADFEVTNQNAATLASICYRLDGIPLAIELAAARVRSLSVEEINRKLDQRFRLLTGGSRTALPRHQTLRATIDWSYDLLGSAERTLLERLAVFAGGFALDAAEAVGAGGDVADADVPDMLCNLVDKSLVALNVNDGRYHLLETVRQYALERLTASNEEARARLSTSGSMSLLRYKPKLASAVPNSGRGTCDSTASARIFFWRTPIAEWRRAVARRA